MPNGLKATINLYEAAIEVMQYSERGVQTRYLDPDSFYNRLSRMASVTTGLLPRNCRLVQEYDECLRYVLEYIPNGPLPLSYKRSQYMVPVPVTLFIAQVTKDDNHVLLHTWCFSLKRPLESLDDEIYDFPYCNVGAGGLVCWGEVEGIRNATRRVLEELPNIFYASPFNGDLDNVNLALNYRGNATTWDRFTAMTQDHLQVYPEDLYVKPHRTSLRTVRDLLAKDALSS